jgi:cobalt/nickel transport system ATP-binding protein
VTLLEVEQLHYTYSDGTQALCGVDLSIAVGDKVGLVGPNGSGKSTLLLCLAGLLKGDGAVRLDGETLDASQVKHLRRRVGLVFQNPDDQLFMPTLADDLAFGPINLGLGTDEVRQRVGDVASQFDLSHMLDRAPHHLSQGQMHVGAIASVLAMQPALLMMDEPTSSLDPRTRRQLIDVLKSLDTTLLIASHDLAMVGTVCSRILIIDEGKIAAAGASADLLSDESLMTKHGLEVWQGLP